MSEGLRAVDFIEHGNNRGRGNLLGIQPFMEQADYASEAAFYHKIYGYIHSGAQRGWIGPRTVVVLPEYLSTWLVIAGEGQAAVRAKTVKEAMQPLVLRHLGPFLIEMLRAKEKERANASVFRVKAESMARIYQSVFSRLAREFATTIVAGSILLPNPQVKDGQVAAGKGAIYNASFVFSPEGRAYPQVSRKIFPVADELEFVQPAAAEHLPVFVTPAGKLGVLVCADSWFPEAYQALKEQGVELVAVPSASTHGQNWYRPWSGYSGWPAAENVDPDDIGRLTEQQAWGKYALAGRMGSSGARAGINVFLYGDLWDLEFTGGRWRVVCGEANIEASRDGAALINLWLE